MTSWVSSCKAKDRRFDSRSGHMPGLWARFPVGVHVRGKWSMFLSHIDVSLPLFLPRFPSLKKIKSFLKIRKINCHTFLKFTLFYRYVITSFVWLMVSAEVLLCCAPVRGALRPSDWGEHAVYRQFAQWMVPDGEECRMSRITASRFNQRASLTPEELQIWGLGKNK